MHVKSHRVRHGNPRITTIGKGRYTPALGCAALDGLDSRPQYGARAMVVAGEGGNRPATERRTPRRKDSFLRRSRVHRGLGPQVRGDGPALALILEGAQPYVAPRDRCARFPDAPAHADPRAKEP